MAYFQNGTDSELIDNECRNCELGKELCPVYLAQCLFNFEQMEEGKERLMQVLHLLIDDNGTCQMKKLIEKRNQEQGKRKEYAAYYSETSIQT
ncbi:MAG: hypothetical protein M0P57_07060 [Syntrophales bacterium]|jgi:hypothetical protein|nr:hypothetical protein [Syntrophales bacterium]MDY0045518.1 hypothetical protein [Syntrophales bacterium]